MRLKNCKVLLNNLSGAVFCFLRASGILVGDCSVLLTGKSECNFVFGSIPLSKKMLSRSTVIGQVLFSSRASLALSRAASTQAVAMTYAKNGAPSKVLTCVSPRIAIHSRRVCWSGRL
jgi:hypothetical protein